MAKKRKCKWTDSSSNVFIDRTLGHICKHKLQEIWQINWQFSCAPNKGKTSCAVPKTL